MQALHARRERRCGVNAPAERAPTPAAPPPCAACQIARDTAFLDTFRTATPAPQTCETHRDSAAAFAALATIAEALHAPRSLRMILDAITTLRFARDRWAADANRAEEALADVANALVATPDASTEPDDFTAATARACLATIKRQDRERTAPLAAIEALTRRATDAEAARVALTFAVGWTAATLRHLAPETVSSYLDARGWRPLVVGDESARWRHSTSATAAFHVDVRTAGLPPLDAEAVEVIAAQERRPATFVVADLLEADFRRKTGRPMRRTTEAPPAAPHIIKTRADVAEHVRAWLAAASHTEIRSRIIDEHSTIPADAVLAVVRWRPPCHGIARRVLVAVPLPAETPAP